jgi:hypothetical protein
MSIEIQQTLSHEKDSNGNVTTPTLSKDAESGMVDDQQDGLSF